MKVVATIHIFTQTGEDEFTTYRYSVSLDGSSTLGQIMDWARTYLPNASINDVTFSQLVEQPK